MITTPQTTFNQWFGHYQPAVAVLTPDVADVQRFSALLDAPVRSGEDAAVLIKSAADVLPVLKPVENGISAGTIEALVYDIPMPALSTRPARPPALVFPLGHKPRQHLPMFFRYCGMIAPLPDGVEIPPHKPMEEFPATVEHLFKRFCWMTALAQSFIYEVVREIEESGIGGDFVLDPKEILGSTDLALFRIFRHRGIAGVAHMYPQFMYEERIFLLRRSIGHEANVLMQSGIECMGVWSPPEIGDRPELASTCIDKTADAEACYILGLYGRDDVKRFEAGEIKIIEDVLKRRIEGEADMHALAEVLRTITPQLARRILPERSLEGFKFDFSGNPPQPTNRLIDETVLMPDHTGMISEELNRPTLWVRRGSTFGEAIQFLVSALAQAKIPDELLKREQLDTTSIMGLANSLFRRYQYVDVWNYTALFEYVHEARMRGIGAEIEPNLERMRDLLDLAGLGVVRERWMEFANPQFVRLMGGQFVRIASRIIGTEGHRQ